jgi:hypothetical protein
MGSRMSKLALVLILGFFALANSGCDRSLVGATSDLRAVAWNLNRVASLLRY